MKKLRNKSGEMVTAVVCALALLIAVGHMQYKAGKWGPQETVVDKEITGNAGYVSHN